MHHPTSLARPRSHINLAVPRGELVIGRQGRVEEITPTALLLACEEAAFYVGASFNPNGGDIMV